jgi:3-hydroxyacyl-CoA dehydrogenase/enoyl-CoA hydratase/3-hydroxybutyryl-CoA epimerase
MQTLEQESIVEQTRSHPRRDSDQKPDAKPSLGPAQTAPASPTIRRQLRDDQICVLTFDRPSSAANIFDRATLAELAEHLEYIAGVSQLKGLIIVSAKPSIFIAGADLNMLSQAASAADARELIELGQNVMNRLAALSMPTVAAIHGAAMGGGLELCLACDYRVASLASVTKMGLPETQLGLLPAWGGSTRLPRLIGLPKALDLIVAGKTLAAKPALKCGLVDELAHPEYLLAVAAEVLRRGKPRRRRRWLVNNPVVATVLALRLHSALLKKTRGNYPAVLSALEAITRGVSTSIPLSLARERELTVDLVQTEACRNLIRVFFLQERAKKLVVPLPTLREPMRVTRAAVIGSGVMGAGIAQWLTARKLPVILRDINAEQVAKGMATIAKVYQEGVKRHVFTAREARDGLDRVFPAPAEVPLRNVDLIIEAAVENLDLKKKVFQSLDGLVGEDAIVATNSSALPVSELAACTRRPERVLGLHFFNPVHRMQLVEIITARQTSPEALARALRFVQQIGKLPVIVKDSPGFLVNRILMPYLIEAGWLFEADASITSLDEAMLDFGMPMGPMRLLDEVGVDVALHVAETLVAVYKDRLAIPDILRRMVNDGLLGRKTGRGFYEHLKGKALCANRRLNDALRAAPHGAKIGDYQSRMVLLMVNEAARCLEEQIAAEPADVDFAMVMGTGFAPFRGGPLRYADSLGASKVVDSMTQFVDSGLRHFEPCALLRTLAGNGKRFYN